ncbi:MAG: TauD/TfdA dioxygenase family protein [Acetobacteraceae bacterium]
MNHAHTVIVSEGPSGTTRPEEPRMLGFRRVAPTFAAEVPDMPVHGDVSPELLIQFISLLHRHRVLVIPTEGVDPADLVAFSRRFGELEIHSRFDNTMEAHREIFCVGNVEREGLKASFSRGVEQWHADSSYRALPSDASLFYAEIVPDEGGDTLFADATAAWRSLDPAMKARIEGLYAIHSLDTLRAWGHRQNPDKPLQPSSQVAAFPPARQPLVRVHPATGAKSLYVCPAVISHIDGIPQAESDALVAELIAHITQPQYVYGHRWRKGDLVMWDNRAVLHTASLFDHTRYQRLMYRTTVAGNAAALSM